MTHAHTPAVSSKITSRRSMLAGLAALGAAAPAVAAPAVAVTAAPANEDAELSALYEEFLRLGAVWQDACAREADADEAYHGMKPGFPKAAIQTEADRRMMLCAGVGDSYSEQDIPRLSQPQRGEEVTTPFPGRPGEVIVRRPVCPEKTARAQEIVRALEDYRAADEAARIMSGTDDAEQVSEKAGSALTVVENRILEMPAKTLTGIIVKARVVAWLNDWQIEVPASGCTSDWFAYSAIADLVRIAGGQANG